MGLPGHIIESVLKADPPDFSEPVEAVVYRFVRELISTHRVSNALYEEAVRWLGVAGVVELVILVGYYCIISMTLNVFEIPLPPGEKAPFASDSE